jgi:hypothetical protein
MLVSEKSWFLKKADKRKLGRSLYGITNSEDLVR